MSGNSNFFVRLSHGATARCLADYAKYVLRDNPDNIVFDIKINDASSNKTAETISKLNSYLTIS